MYMYIFKNMYIQCHVNERCRRKEERSKQGRTNNKAKQHNSPKVVIFLKENELPQVLWRLHDILSFRKST